MASISVADTAVPPVDDVLLRVLADPVRAQIVRALAVEQLCTCHLVEITGARQTNVSNHLRVLRESGVVAAQAHGRFTYYRLRPEVLAGVARELTTLSQAAQRAGLRRRPCR